MANMPIYDLWGGKSRSSAAVYGHANGNNPDEVEEKVQNEQARQRTNIKNKSKQKKGNKSEEFTKNKGNTKYIN